MPAVIETTKSNAMFDLQSEITEKTTETNGSNIEYKRKYDQLLADIARKSQKRARRVNEKRVRKKVKDIAEKNQLGTTQKYQLSRLTKNVIWKCVKFWHVELEKKAVKKALKHLEIKESGDKARVQEFVSAYMEESIIVKRNNTIGAIKKLVCSRGHCNGELTRVLMI